MAKMMLQKKISVAKLVGKTTAVKVSKGEFDGVKGQLDCGKFIGRASGVKTGTSDFGDWRALTGQFRGISPEGAVMDSGICFMPDVALDMVIGQLEGGAQAVDFAFQIVAVEDEESTVGFSYRAVPLLQPEEDNVITRLMNKINPAQIENKSQEPSKTDAETLAPDTKAKGKTSK